MKKFTYVMLLVCSFGLAKAQYVGIGTSTPVAKLHVFGGRLEVTNTDDATGTANSGVVEIGNSLRIDGNEIITNTGTTLYLQNDNNGDLRMDGSTFWLDASANVIGFTNIPTAPFVLGAATPVHCVYYPLEIGSDGNAGQQLTLGYYRGSDPEVNPEQTGGWGYVGYNVAAAGEYWWRMYSGGFITASSRDIKRNIHPTSENNAITDYLVSNIKDLKPSLYNYHNEYDEMMPGLENHYRPAFRLGLIADESPDYVLDEGFAGVDAYALATLGIVGVQHNMKTIENLSQNATIQDFGSVSLSGNEIWVNYNENFGGNIPVVTVTSNNPDVVLSIVEKTSTQFKVRASQTASNLTFDWIAMAKNTSISTNKTSSALPADIKDKLDVPEGTKQNIIDFYQDFESTLTPGGK